MPRFPKLAVRRYCPRESMVPPASPDGPAVIRQMRELAGGGVEPGHAAPGPCATVRLRTVRAQVGEVIVWSPRT